GAPVSGLGANGHWGGDSLVLEVDESFGTFSRLVPHALGLLNVEADHLDHYGTLDVLEEAFAQLVGRTTGPVVIWGDDEGARRESRRQARGHGSSQRGQRRRSGCARKNARSGSRAHRGRSRRLQGRSA